MNEEYDERSHFKIEAEYSESKKRFIYTLYQSKNMVWVKIAESRNEGKLLKIMEKLKEYPKMFIGPKSDK